MEVHFHNSGTNRLDGDPVSKRKRAEKLIGKIVETEYHPPAKVLAVEVHDTTFDGRCLCFKLEYQSQSRRKGAIDWEKVNSRVRYTVIK